MSSSSRYRRVIQIELNEISADIIRKLTLSGSLPNFQRIQDQWTYAKTRSETQYERIEPWIQWVTAHTGKTFDEHGIFRLGDVDQLKHPQLWEILADHGIESAILGSMNASRGRTESGGFFFPDPWSKRGLAHPPELQPLWDLISRKVQGHAVSQPKVIDSLEALKAALRFRVPASLYVRIACQFLAQKVDPLCKWKLAALFDEFLAEIFLRVLENPRYRFCTLFLNAVAHYQHHYWRNFESKGFGADVNSPDCRPHDNPIALGYKTYDRIIGRILKQVSLDDTLILIVSGLSQVPFTLKEAEGGMNYYRLRDHQEFLNRCGFGHIKAHPMMSRDWQIQATSAIEIRDTAAQLAELHVAGEKVFKIEIKEDGFAFLETAITRQMGLHEVIYLGSKPIGRFSDLFVNIAIKSGHHTGIGSLWMSQPQEDLVPTQSTAIPLTRVFDIGRAALL